ncbi:aromatic-ring-hydroxylating dioxygenase subunit beta [Streptomyces sp. NPDC096934]|uniref:aromatic-ring-hydroxylating dioxygenase subunit beta n=1 Tax=Streptomyces sp. NPDC096934 TaxID=3155551 RepID=UPI0033186B35
MTTTEQQPQAAPASAPRTTSLELQHRVQQFLYAEAELLDDHRYEEWLALWTQDAHYWIPTRMTRTVRERHQELSPLGAGAHVSDDHEQLRGRIRRITSGIQWSEEPPSRTRRLLTNIRVDEGADGELAVRTNFWVYRSRLERHQDWFAGERFDVLRPAEEGSRYPYRIADRKIVFEQTTLLAPSVSIFF